MAATDVFPYYSGINEYIYESTGVEKSSSLQRSGLKHIFSLFFQSYYIILRAHIEAPDMVMLP